MMRPPDTLPVERLSQYVRERFDLVAFSGGKALLVSRIMKGYDPAGGNLPFVKDAFARDPVQTAADLAKLEYIVNWSTMTLQDAIDFNVLITRTTESIQRFSDGTVLNPGGITGVGGDINVAALLPDGGFTWIRKKQLDVEGSAMSKETVQT
jgi:hypothetical protein